MEKNKLEGNTAAIISAACKLLFEIRPKILKFLPYYLFFNRNHPRHRLKTVNKL